MDKTIKTRTVVKDIKTLTKHAPGARTIKSIAIKAKGEAGTPTSSKQGDTSSCDGRRWAEEHSEQAVNAVVRSTTHGVVNVARLVRGERQKEQSEGTEAAKAALLSEKKKRRQSKVSRDKARSRKQGQSNNSGEKPPKTTGRVNANARCVGVPSSNAATQSVNINNLSAKSASTPSCPTSAGFARVHAKQTGQAIAIPKAIRARTWRKAAAHGARSLARIAAASARSLATVLTGIGGLTAAIIVIVCLVGLVATSAFGIFFAGGDMGDGNPTLREAVTELNEEYNQRIEDIKAANPHDEVAMTGSKAAWKEALAVFSVKVTTSPDNPLDAITLDAQRQTLLREVFWDMNQIDSRVEEHTVVEITLEDDGTGNQAETAKETTRRTLYITVTCKTADEAATSYGFTVEQTDILHQMLDSRYDDAWYGVLYGIRQGSGDIVEVAASQVGNIGGAPYWSWYGFFSRVEWCACFVSWCANECGYIEAGSVPRFSYCPTGIQWFKDAGRWQDRGYTPQPGDIVFFDWGGDGVSDHVGIVESCYGSTVNTIEGNSSDTCRRNNYSVGSANIMGYGVLSD